MDVKIEDSWKSLLADEFDKDYFNELVTFVKQEYQLGTVYPPGSQIFRAFDFCPLEEVKVVIIGQDPYHGPGQANGLCFSVAEGVPMPPSLLNIFKELKTDLNKDIPPHGSLEKWAKQGVLLLNATLTVKARQAGSHQKKGWENFTDAVISKLASERSGLVFILWGAYAQRKGEMIDPNRHYVIKSAHPSPFAAHRGFFGSKPFSKTNAYLEKQGRTLIDW
ncbi:uracil-DNA glycosylase [Marinoscillum sp. MHG1-6]|uniref:uracil-DNA glycosylase n=1 Tax=Marinoscillum sp. MHG1-6 TaxID=2959627 RepID=UPI0021577B6E|nr:uracil-DNA glycosylase [Marinoscillum sp. MHG1-6]